MRGRRGASNTAVFAGVTALVVVGGIIIFFVATPGGRKAFRSFLDWAAGKEGEETAEGDGLDEGTVRFLERARQALKEGKLDAAEVAANAVLTRVPDNIEAREMILEIEKRREQAEQLRRKTVHDEALREGRRFLAAGDLDRGEEFAKKAVEAVPDSEEAKALLAKVGEEKARIEAELARRREEAELLARRGMTAITAEEYEKALSLARQSLALDGKNATGQFVKMQAEYEMRRAQGETKDVRSDDQRRAAADRYCDLAKLSWEDKDYEGTTRFAEKALDIWPAHEGARYLRRKAKEKLRALAEEKKPSTAGAEEVVAFLRKLDAAIMREDAEGLGRLLSPSSEGGLIVGVAAGRGEEIENARGFFDVASEIRIKRETELKDVSAKQDFADAVSRFRISYRIGGGARPAVSISRQFKARYSLAREGGVWRLRSVTVEDERP